VTFKRRIVGVGSLGRERFLALGEWHGGLVAREAKAWVPSAVFWAADGKSSRDFSDVIVRRAIRSPDPMLHFGRYWITRRLAPDCSKIELADLPKDRDERRLLMAMGAETANVHAGDKAAAALIVRHLGKAPQGWLVKAAVLMAAEVTDDWRDYRQAS
jgi:hypothetical protein